MTNTVRNKASETITVLGGAVALPSAVRNSDSTTTIRVNDVTMTRIDGARQHRDQRDQLDHALGQAGALAEIDADVLGCGRMSGRYAEDCQKQPEGSSAHPVAV